MEIKTNKTGAHTGCSPGLAVTAATITCVWWSFRQAEICSGKLWGENRREGSAWLLRGVAGVRKLEAGHPAAGILCDCFGDQTWLSLISSELEVGTKNRMLAVVHQTLTALGGLLCGLALAPPAGR